MEIGPLSDSQIILNADYNGWFYDGKVEGTFGIAGLQLFPDLAVEIVFDYESDYTYETPFIDFYGVLPNHDWDNSDWYWLGPHNSRMRSRSSTQLAFLIGPASVDYDNALAAGETGVLVDMSGGGVTGMAWRYVPVTGPVGGLTPAAAPALEVGTVTAATLQGTSLGPGASYYDEETASGQYLEQNARWWTFTPEESGWYEYDVASLSGSAGGSAWTWSAAYWYQGVPSANELPIAHSNYDHTKDSNEAQGLVELTAGVTYYLRVTARPGYGADPKWRVWLERATWFCGHAGPDPLQAKEITNPDGFCSALIPNYGFPTHWYYEAPHTAWWTFVAPRSGPFKASAMLTQKNGTRINQWWMYTRLFTNDSYWTGIDNPLWIDDINQSAGDGDWDEWFWVKEGERYWLAVLPYQQYDGPLDYVLQTRYMDFSIEEVENEIIMARTDGVIQPTTVMNPSQYFTTTIDATSSDWVGMQTAGFQGYMEFWRSFGGPQPGQASEINNAWSCMWPKARKGQGGTWWYSKYNGVEWDGGEGTGGFGNCPVYTPDSWASAQYYGDSPVGWHWHAESGMYGEAYVRAWCHSQSLGLHLAMERLGPNAALTSEQLAAQLPSGGESAGFMGYYDEETYGYPSDAGAVLMGIQVAADEQSSQWANPGQAPPTEWYVLRNRYTARLPDYDDLPGWGPWTFDATYDLRFSGGPEGPESLAAAGTLVATYSGGTPTWQDINWQEYWDYETEMIEGGRDTSDARGLLFVAMNAHLKSNAAPPTPPTLDSNGFNPVNHYVARLGQVMCVKLQIKSQPYLVTYSTSYVGSPGSRLPDCPWEWPQSSIDGDYEAGGREFTRVP